MTALRVALMCVATLTGACGEPRLIGRSCGPSGCAEAGVGLPLPSGCGTQLVLPDATVPAGMRLERCVLFPLDGLDQPPGDERAYLTRVEVAFAPATHDLELRIAEEIPDNLMIMADGTVDCAELQSRAIAWVPLMTTDRDHDAWDFADAPLVASRAHWLQVNDSHTNLTGHAVEAGVTVNLLCADAQPATVSQAFEMAKRGKTTVAAGTRAKITANCTFQKDVLVSRLYRRTRLISGYQVSRLGDAEPLWVSGLEFTHDLEPPLRFETGEGFTWSCEYVNDSLDTIQVGGNTDSCALLGIYRLPDGAADASPEHCVL